MRLGGLVGGRRSHHVLRHSNSPPDPVGRQLDLQVGQVLPDCLGFGCGWLLVFPNINKDFVINI